MEKNFFESSPEELPQHSRLADWKRFFWESSAVVLIVVVLLVVLLHFFFWSVSFDTTSCRIRRSTHFAAWTFAEKISENVFSKTLSKVKNLSTKPNWRTDSTFTVFSPHVSPHYRRFHGVASSIHQLEMLIDMYHVSEENQLLLAEAILKWSNESMDHPFPGSVVGSYIETTPIKPRDSEDSEKLNDFIHNTFQSQ